MEEGGFAANCLQFAAKTDEVASLLNKLLWPYSFRINIVGTPTGRPPARVPECDFRAGGASPPLRPLRKRKSQSPPIPKPPKAFPGTVLSHPREQQITHHLSSFPVCPRGKPLPAQPGLQKLRPDGDLRRPFGQAEAVPVENSVNLAAALARVGVPFEMHIFPEGRHGLGLAEEYEVTPQEMREMLRDTYDGYRFSRNSPDIYNPFSLMKAFNQRELQNYWFESGTPSYLIRQLRRFRTDITKLDDLQVPSSAFDQPTENMLDALPLLYQSGYMTIKGYDRWEQTYTLGIPNKEVRVGFTEGLLPLVTGMRGSDVQVGFALRFWRALRKSDTDLALRELQAYLESLPYIEGFKKKLEEVTTAEGFYEWSFYLIFSMLNVYVQTQVKCARGRADMVVFMPDAIYVMELKINGTARDALDQIENKGYALRYATDGRRIVKVGMGFSVEKRAMTEFIIGQE